MQVTGGTNLGPVRVLVQTAVVESESAESMLLNENRWLCIATKPVRLSPKPSGRETPAGKNPEGGDAM